METRDWGYTLIIPGFGLLPDDFPDAYIRVFDLSNGEFAYLRDDIAIPVEPFSGTMGVCPAGARAGDHAARRVRGNMDTRQLAQGTTLTEGYDLSREDAYVLSSLSVDIRISEVVDAGQYVVSALLPVAVFTRQPA
jgi:acetamidase/formamidase